MIPHFILSQITDVLATQSKLAEYGALGIFCIFLMGLVVWMLIQANKSIKAQQSGNRDPVMAIKTQSHRMAGLERAIMMELFHRGGGLNELQKTLAGKRLEYLDSYLARNDTIQ